MPTKANYSVPLAALVATLLSIHAAPAAAQADSSRQTPPKVVKHTVKRGDTLWDIARFYLKDPYRWPEVFHHNTDVVKDPHWIYPGEVLSIDGDAVKEEVAAKVGDDGFVAARVLTRAAPDTPAPQRTTGATVFLAAQGASSAARAGSLAKPPSYTVKKGEQEDAPILLDYRKPIAAGKVVSAVDRGSARVKSDAGFRLYDAIYVTLPPGTQPQPGTQIVLARETTLLSDVGRVVEPTGILQVDSAISGNMVSGTIVKQFQAIRAGQITLPHEPVSRPTTVRPVQGDYPVTGKLVWLQNQPVLASLQTYAIVTLPASAQVGPGDELTVLDQPRPGSAGAAAQLPPVPTATLQVVRVTPFGVTTIIVGQTQPKVRPGMPARLTAKMP